MLCGKIFPFSGWYLEQHRYIYICVFKILWSFKANINNSNTLIFYFINCENRNKNTLEIITIGVFVLYLYCVHFNYYGGLKEVILIT